MSETEGLNQMSTEQAEEFTFNPEHLSDFTVHFLSASYHLHRFKLNVESKWFANLLSRDMHHQSSDCKLTDRCQQVGHGCIQLPGSDIGGKEFTVAELADFFEHMSSGINRKEMLQWRSLLKIHDLVDYRDSRDEWHLAQVIEVSFAGLVRLRYADNDRPVVQTTQLGSEDIQQAYSETNEEKWQSSIEVNDEILCLNTPSKWLSARVIAKENDRVQVCLIDSDTKRKEWIDTPSNRISYLSTVYRESLNMTHKPAGLRLSHYFVADGMLQYYQERALYCAQKLKKKRKQVDNVWRLLCLADQLHWADLRNKLIPMIIDFDRSPNMMAFHRLISHETSAQLFSAALAAAARR